MRPPSVLGRPLLVATLALGLGTALASCSEGAHGGQAADAEERAVPVEVGTVERGPLTYRRTVSGSLEASAEFGVTPEVGGRIARLLVDLGDPVERGQVVARLDNDEFLQAVQQAEADLAVARASEQEAESGLEFTRRALARLESLREDGVTSESQFDAAQTDEAAARARLQVTRASVARAEALLRAARIRLGYTEVTAEWSGGDGARVVAERFVDEGGSARANAPLLTVVQLDPVVAVVFVAERDYRLLEVGQRAVLSTDAYPGRTFEGRVARIAPVFRSATRQARVELEIANPDAALKPGMFVRATLELEHVADAVTVPWGALAERGGEDGVLVLNELDSRVRWHPVEVSFREGERVRVLDEDLSGRVVTLGHELCDDGALVDVVEQGDAATAGVSE